MKVVLDTNVLISGIFFSGPPSRILAAWADGRFELLASVEILNEYHRVAERLHSQFPTVDIKAALDLVTRETRIVEPLPVPIAACDDPDDLMFLACALAGRADCIVTCDRALLRASGCRRIEVVTPREFTRQHLQAHDVAHLLDEQRILRQLEGLAAVRLQPEAPPDAADAHLTQPAGFRHVPRAPMGGVGGSRLQRQADHLFDGLVAYTTRRPGARLVSRH